MAGRQVGRNTPYAASVARAICDRLAEGESLRAICRDETMPAIWTVMRWLRTRPAFRNQYEIARIAQADALFELMQEIADGGENVPHARLRVDTLKWRLARIAPKKYGDKVTTEVTGEHGGPVKTELVIRFV